MPLAQPLIAALPALLAPLEAIALSGNLGLMVAAGAVAGVGGVATGGLLRFLAGQLIAPLAAAKREG